MPVPVGVISPLVLAGVLVVSALAKLPHPDETRSAIVALRLPPVLDRAWVGRSLPVAELVVAAGVVAPWVGVSRYAAWAALGLFVAYLVIIGRALRIHPRPTCACFGRIGPSRVDRWTLLRNVILVTLAALTVWFTQAGHTVPSVLTGATGAESALLGGAALAALLVMIVRPGHRARTAERGQASSRADAVAGRPGVLAEGVDTGPHRRPQLLVLVDCYCGPTYRAAAELASWQADLPDIDVRLVFSGIDPLTPDEGGAAPDATRSDHESHLWDSLNLSMSPAAVLVGTDGAVLRGPVTGWTAVVDFVESVTSGRH